jgi:hypothetical protein
MKIICIVEQYTSKTPVCCCCGLCVSVCVFVVAASDWLLFLVPASRRQRICVMPPICVCYRTRQTLLTDKTYLVRVTSVKDLIPRHSTKHTKYCTAEDLNSYYLDQKIEALSSELASLLILSGFGSHLGGGGGGGLGGKNYLLNY